MVEGAEWDYKLCSGSPLEDEMKLSAFEEDLSEALFGPNDVEFWNQALLFSP